MASIANSVRKAIEDFSTGDIDFAMLHACNAVDGTARKVFPTLRNKIRFTRLLRENYVILGSMAAPSLDLTNTRWPVRVNRPTAPGGDPDFADVVYGVHRCTHGHGDVLPDGFELIENARGAAQFTTLQISPGKVQLSDRTIFGLLAVAVLNPANANEQIAPDYFLSYGETRLLIHEWWSRADDFLSLVAAKPAPAVALDFGDWMHHARTPTEDA